MCFSTKPNLHYRVKHWDGPYGGGGNKYQFPDGSTFETGGIPRDTWGGDKSKIAIFGRVSNLLCNLQEAYEIFRNQGDWDVCAEIAQRAIDLHRDNPWGWLSRGTALTAMGMTRDAYLALRPAVEVFAGQRDVYYKPIRMEIFFTLARYAARLGEFNEARHWLKSLFCLAEEEEANSTAFDNYRKKALCDADLQRIQDAVPELPLAWRIRKLFGF